MTRIGVMMVSAFALLVAGCSKSSKAITLTTSNFEERVLKSKQPVFVDFWAEWCGPCKRMDPIIRELAEEYDGRVVFGKLNVDDYPEIVARYNVNAFPTFLVFKDGELKERTIGMAPKLHLSNILGALQ
jgi:thioredoxin 1